MLLMVIGEFRLFGVGSGTCGLVMVVEAEFTYQLVPYTPDVVQLTLFSACQALWLTYMHAEACFCIVRLPCAASLGPGRLLQYPPSTLAA